MYQEDGARTVQDCVHLCTESRWTQPRAQGPGVGRALTRSREQEEPGHAWGGEGGRS